MVRERIKLGLRGGCQVIKNLKFSLYVTWLEIGAGPVIILYYFER